MKATIWFSLCILFSAVLMADPRLPKVYQHIKFDAQGRCYVDMPKQRYYQIQSVALYTREQMIAGISGTSQGLRFDFKRAPLFYLSVQWQNTLAQQSLRRGLRSCLRAHGIRVGQLTMRVLVPGQRWVLLNITRQQRQRFILQHQDRGIAVSLPLQGWLYYGLINPQDGRYPYPVYSRYTAAIIDGQAVVNIKKYLRGRYDTVAWEKHGRGTLGYRVVREDGLILYDGKISFRGTGPFRVGPSIVQGPFVNLVGPRSLVISFDTRLPIKATVKINQQEFSSPCSRHHEVSITGLAPDQQYTYTVQVGDYCETYSCRTAPLSGTRRPFVFAYASDSRAGVGGGERNLNGVNTYILKKLMAVVAQRQAAFVQFSGDLINGYHGQTAAMELEYANWKRTIEPFAHYLPVYPAFGNHEILECCFDDGRYGLAVDRFPLATHSAEALFAQTFVLPTNGPFSEDGSSIDPDPQTQDFPPYRENVFYYTYDNIAMVVLNSDYLYSRSLKYNTRVGGNLHGYIMDKQLQWLTQVLRQLEQNPQVDFIFVTHHTPVFPNGGHRRDAMWYNGNNHHRPVIAGQRVAQGIIERRDQYLKALMHTSSKVLAILTGDEHNYSRMLIKPGISAYPHDWKGTQISNWRPLWQINNGAAGAPYYAQEKMPWSDYVQCFSTQPVVVFFYVQGRHVRLEVVNPDTLEIVDRATLH